MHHRDLETVRILVRKYFAERVADFDPQSIRETILLRGSRVVGQQFILGKVKVHWLAGTLRLQIFEDGLTASEIELAQSSIVHKAA